MTTLLTTGNMFKTKSVHVPDDFLFLYYNHTRLLNSLHRVDKFRRVMFLGKKEKRPFIAKIR